MMSSKRLALVFQRALARAPGGRFGPSALGFKAVEDGGSVSVSAEDSGVIKMQLPRWSQGEEGIPPLATIVALIDEASSYSMALADKKGRFGVSVLLEGTLLPESKIGVGEGLVATTRVRKSGRTMGFADIDICAEDGRPIARGRHIKYLQMGSIFADNVGSAARLPFVASLIESYAKRFPLHPTASDFDEIFGEFDREVELQPILCNPWGSLHGGAACLLAETAAQRLKTAGTHAISLTACFLRSLKATSRSRSVSVDANLRPGDSTVVDAVLSSAVAGAPPAVDVTVRYGPSP